MVSEVQRKESCRKGRHTTLPVLLGPHDSMVANIKAIIGLVAIKG